MTESWRVILGPILGQLVGAAAAYAQLRWQIVIPVETQAALVTSAIALGGIIGTLTKRAVNAHVNPTNADSPSVAKIEAREAKEEAKVRSTIEASRAPD